MKRLKEGLVILLICIAIVWVGILSIDYVMRQRALSGDRVLATAYIVYLNQDFHKGGCLAYFSYEVNCIVYTGFHGDLSSNCAKIFVLGQPVYIEYSRASPSYSKFIKFDSRRKEGRPVFVDSLILEFEK